MGVIQSWDGTTTGVSFGPRVERLQECHSSLDCGEYMGVIQS